MNVITQKLSPLYGHFKFGYNVCIGYFEQLASKSSSQKSIYQDFYENFPKLNDREVRSALGAFLFSGNDVNKQLCTLSGGELVRLELCKILQKRPNVLILDEPTNHMDIVSKETIEKDAAISEQIKEMRNEQNEVTKTLRNEQNEVTNTLRNEIEGNVNVLNARIATLEKTVAELTSVITAT